MPKIRQRIACKAVIRRGPKILLLREAPTYKDGTNVGKYHIPGGRIEPGEPIMDGLTREVLEETGLSIYVDKIFYASEWFPVIRGEKNQIVGMYFACRTKPGRVRLSEEHDVFVWVEPAEAASLPLMSPEDEALEAFLKIQN